MTLRTVTTSAKLQEELSPLAILVQVASQFESSIHFLQDERRVNAKSIMGMMTISFDEGKEIVVEADGKDEAQAVEGLAAYLTEGN